MIVTPKLITGEDKSGPSKAELQESYQKALDESGYTDAEARSYWNKRKDPYSRESLDDVVAKNAPKISIKNNNISISAPQEVLDSPFTKQLQQQLDGLRGVDLGDPNVVNAIDQLNKEVQTTFVNAAVGSLGWSKDEWDNYQLAIQAVSGTNPMLSKDYLAWGPNGVPLKDEKGKIVMKTPGEWIQYWRDNYSTNERSDMFDKSLKSDKPYERIMVLVMGQGGDKAVEGFDLGEKIGQGVSAFANIMGRLPEGLFRLFAEDNNTTKLESLTRKLEIPREALRDMNISNDDLFNSKKESIKGKAWSELSDDDKAFVLEVAISQESSMIRNGADRELTKFMAERAGKNVDARTTDDVYSEDDDVSRDAIDRVLANGSFDKYQETRNNYDTWQGYEEWTNEAEQSLAKSAAWSGSSQFWGNLAGTIGRFLWEDAVFRGITGGVTGKKGLSMNQISDIMAGSVESGKGILGWLAKKGINPKSSLGRGVLDFGARLVGTIPEDILQTAVDNVITYNADENKNLLNPEEMSENFKNNLIFMSLFNAARAGVNAVRLAKYAKDMVEAADLSSPIDIDGIVADADDMARAANRGQAPVVEGDTVYIVDNDGSKKTINNATPEEAGMVQRTLFDLDNTPPGNGESISKAVDAETAKISGESPEGTVKVEIDTPDGRVVVDAPDYRFRNRSEAISTKLDGTPAAVRHGHKAKLQAVMNDFRKAFNDFKNRFGDVQASDFDFVWYQTRHKGLSPEQIIGMVDPTTNRTITQNMIDAMKWWSEQPFTKELRMASLKALGKDVDDFDVLGYLPHTTYDPSSRSFDEAPTGQLWQSSTGASVLNDVGEYKGFGGDFDSRYRTFASNMLWDIDADAVAAAKAMEEAALDGRTITPEEAKRAAEGKKKIENAVAESKNTKEWEEAFSSESDAPDFEKLGDETIKQAENSDLGQATHDVYGDNLYAGKDTGTIVKQSGAVRQSFDTLGNTMRNTVIKDNRGNVMSWYDWGGADYYYADRNAWALMNRFTREGGDFREMYIDYLMSHSHRSREAAEFVADRMMKRMGEVPGQLTKADALRVLSNSMKYEAISRFRKWLVLADYSNFNDTTKKAINRFLYNHIQMDALKRSQKITNKMAKVLNKLTTARYDALFYGNFKNALLQVTELNRFFSSFKWGDVGSMARRMATDSVFRARVNDYAKEVIPGTATFRTELYGDYADLADGMKSNADGTTFVGAGKRAKEVADKIGLAPIEAAENFKNRMMLAALVAEADNMGLSGDEALRRIRNRFERVAIAMDDLGRIGLASNPLAKTMLFLQNFQIRELGMHIYNISDEWKAGKNVPIKVYNATKYLTKVFGSKMATALIMARLGYPASQILGVDPFGVLDNYTNLDEEDMEWQDYLMKSPIFSGGMTSLISDMYFMARKAFEESNPKTISEETGEILDEGSSYGLNPLSFDQLMNVARGFIPGNVFMNRVNQMNEMMDTGWATSATGNKMYTAPTDPLNTTLGYLFGRSATENAQQYNQTYGDNLLQTLGRFNPFRQYGEFDPIDNKNYSDWFKGDGNDLQQFSKGIRYFKQQRDRILDVYEEAIKNGRDQDQISEAQNDMNQRLDGLYEQLDRFVDAYELKNGTINSSMVKQILSTLNTGRNYTGTEEERRAKQNEEYDKAETRYSQLGMSPVGTYSGPTESNPDREVTYWGSPQWNAAKQGYYDAPSEVVGVLKQADAQLKPLRNEIKKSISSVYNSKDRDTLESIQEDYLRKFDNVVGPIIASYGNQILSNREVANQLRLMLSTGVTKQKADLVPTSHYSKNKYGRYQNMPNEEVDISAWALHRYDGDIFTNPTINSSTTVKEDLNEIKRLYREGKPGRARARALELYVRVDNQIRSLNKDDYSWLINFLEKTGGN